MIEVIYGEDAVSVDDALAELTASVGADDLRDINSITLRAEDVAPADLITAAFTIPFMTDLRLVAVKGLLSRFERGARRGAAARGGSRRNPLGEWADMVEQLPSLPPTTHLAFVDGRLARNNPMLRRLAAVGEAREFPLPRDRDMPGWIANRARTLGVRIDPAACSALADALGREPRLIDSELRKLALYVDGGAVRAEDARQMVAYVREANIFQMVDAVTDGRTDVALRLTRRITEDGSPAAYVMAMLARQVRLLLIAKDMESSGISREEIGPRLRLSGWALNKTIQQARRLSLDYLIFAHGQLTETDLTLKTKPIEERLALEMLIADLTTRRF